MEPSLPLLVDHPPEGNGWIHEIKFDGYRIQAHLENGTARLLTRSSLDWTHQYPDIATALETSSIQSAILDGEIVALDEKGRSDFQNLQMAMKQDETTPLVYYAFDLLELNGKDLRIRFSSHIEGSGEQIWNASCEQELEGIVSKRIDSTYSSGQGDTWVKTKCKKRQEFVIGGYTGPEGARGYFGALLLGVYEKDQLRFVGKCGTGFSQKELVLVFSRMKKLEQSKSPFELNSPRGRGLHWLKPKLVAEVHFANWTKDNILRMPSYQGLREDKAPRQIVKDFDPAPDVPFSEVKKAVRKLKKTLDQIGLVSFLKVTGGKGLHVHIPVDPVYTWDEIKSFAKVLADEMVESDPDHFVSTMSKKERKGKIFVDYLRNGRGATAVAPYSLRASERSAVAMPIEWNDLTTLKDPALFTLPKALAHLKKRKRDPWAGISKVHQEISILNTIHH